VERNASQKIEKLSTKLSTMAQQAQKKLWRTAL